ncbi:MAG: hypothetical protein AAGD88_17500 [Bacteroidota bacterium]
MLSLETLYSKLPFLGFAFFVVLTLKGLFRLKRFLRLPFLLFLFLLMAVPFIKDLLWLFAALELSIWSYCLARKWPWPMA